MSHPLAEQGSRPSPSRVVALAAALLTALAALVAASPASAATPVIVNDTAFLESLAAGGDSGGAANRITLSLAVRHDPGRRVTGIKIDDDWDGSNQTSDKGTKAVTAVQPAVTGGFNYSRVTYSYQVPTANMDFDCNLTLGTTNKVDKTIRVLAVLDNNAMTDVKTSSIHFTKSEGCNGSDDPPFVYGQTQSATELTPGGKATFTFNGDDPDSAGDADFMGVRWRVRRLNDNVVVQNPRTACDRLGDNKLRSIEATFPDRGRYVVEAEALNEGSGSTCANTNANKWFRLGAVDVNGAQSGLTLELDPPAKRLDYGATETTISATAADGDATADGGAISAIAWDLDGSEATGVDGFEKTGLGAAITTGPGRGSNQITAAEREQRVQVGERAPGTYDVRARIFDGGALSAADNINRVKTVTATYVVDAPPVAATPALAHTDSATPVDVPLSGTDADRDTLTWSVGAVTPGHAGQVASDGTKATFTPAAGYVGTASFRVTADDGYQGKNAPSASATATVQVHPTGPDTTITAAPAPVAEAAQATFAFESPEAVRFECRLDGAAEWTACESGVEYRRLTNGSHTFEVRGYDATGNVEFRPARHTWTVWDVAVPTATITSAPPARSTATTATVAFEADEEGARFECRLDDGDAAACDDGTVTYADLADGPHTVSVVAVDVGGNRSAPATATFEVDTTAPVTTIDAGPDGPTNATTPEFRFSSNDPDAAYTCRIDDGEPADCDSPYTAETLGEGPHTFAVHATDALGNAEAPAKTRTFTVDVTAPAAPRLDGPEGRTKSTDAQWTFTADAGDADVASFECALDGADFAACDAPQSVTGLTEGEHTFAVRAIDAAGNTGATATKALVVDLTAPVTTIDEGPAGPTNTATPRFAFSSEAAATFQCRVDDEAFGDCDSPYTAAELDEGPHTFEVQATDTAGNIESPAVRRTFTVDVTAPAAPTVEPVTSPTADPTPQLTFTHDEDDATFACRVDGGEPEACASPLTLAELEDGDHTVTVVAIDAAGNRSQAATAAFTVDTTAPATTIDAGPDGPTNDATPRFAFSADDDDATFACSVDGAAPVDCSSPYDVPADLAEGEHTFAVAATDALGNAESPAVTRTFTVDVTAPAAPVLGGPEGPTADATPEFTLAHEEQGVRFECRVDGPNGEPCTSPYAPGELEDGPHTIRARAIDAAGNASPWTGRAILVDTTAPAGAIDGGPTGTIAESTARFTFASAEEGATFECRIDGGAWAACSSPYTTPALADGEHVFEVRAVDALGNAATPQRRTFTVSVPRPRRDEGQQQQGGVQAEQPAAPQPAPAAAESRATPAPALPKLTGLKLSRSVLKGTAAKAVLRFRLSQAAALQVELAQRGTRKGRTVYTIRRTIDKRAKAGAGSVTFGVRSGARTLAPGTYRATVTAKDARGKRIVLGRVTFRVARR